MKTETSYPNLFSTVETQGHRAKFEMLSTAPKDFFIGNAYIVPKIGDKWLYVIDEKGRLQLPGGKKEPNEVLLQTVQRELMEEAGAVVKSFSLIGGWSTFLKTERLKKEHVSFPEMYMVVGCGEVEIISEPTNPEGAGISAEVKVAPLEEVVGKFTQYGRVDLAELYLLCASSRMR